jgi:hypothetical protein
MGERVALSLAFVIDPVVIIFRRCRVKLPSMAVAFLDLLGRM